MVLFCFRSKSDHLQHWNGTVTDRRMIIASPKQRFRILPTRSEIDFLLESKAKFPVIPNLLQCCAPLDIVEMKPKRVDVIPRHVTLRLEPCDNTTRLLLSSPYQPLRNPRCLHIKREGVSKAPETPASHSAPVSSRCAFFAASTSTRSQPELAFHPLLLAGFTGAPKTPPDLITRIYTRCCYTLRTRRSPGDRRKWSMAQQRP